ncbi:MAG: hypothetical protein KAS32_13650 [Candidatus Peribacteraceae bacterium]|nr:hypothetical protein [Candidatus Peribacteraceae bacterium]
MKTKYEWMNDGKEFELPDFAKKMNPQEELDMLHVQLRAEETYEDIKPKGIRPKDDKDLTKKWIVYLNMSGKQANIDTVVYALKTIDPKVTKKTMLEHLDSDAIADITNQLFRKGKLPEKEKETEEQPEKKS